MGTGTVFPEALMNAAHTFAMTLGGAGEEWQNEECVEEASGGSPPAAAKVDPDEVSFVRELRRNIRAVPQSVKKALARGVDVTSFLAKWEAVVARHGSTPVRLLEIVSKAKARGLPPPRQAIFAELEGLGKDIASVLDFLQGLLAELKSPLPPIDRDRVANARAAYSKGETKSFRRSSEESGKK
ncbi:MAG TPA: hypothetical protein VG013_18300 [Gemmataceae bacterium]|jgi:hypothetical protein|nr:hypothetical protein [Gemmataceae bacterium]